jgi:hypothetical protein
LDVTDRTIIEHNEIRSTEKGVVPHGNSISGYDFNHHPSSRWWSYARNHMSRPASQATEPTAWTQRETVTTDGSGGVWTTGVVAGTSPTGELLLTKAMTTDLWTIYNRSGNAVSVNGKNFLTIKVLGGGGVGQTRMVTGWTRQGNTSTLTLEHPLDGHFVTTQALTAAKGQRIDENSADVSIVEIRDSIGTKAIVGNKFNWTEVVQFYSNTLGGVVADNTLTDCNVRNGGNVGNASVGAYGACYNGAGPVFYTEFLGNTQTRSDGISLFDNQALDQNDHNCKNYSGVYIRWAAGDRVLLTSHFHPRYDRRRTRTTAITSRVATSCIRLLQLLTSHSTIFPDDVTPLG